MRPVCYIDGCGNNVASEEVMSAFVFTVPHTTTTSCSSNMQNRIVISADSKTCIARSREDLGAIGVYLGRSASDYTKVTENKQG